MRFLPAIMSLAFFCLAAAVLSGCGGMSSGLTTSGTPLTQYGSAVSPTEPITVVFLRQLDYPTLANNIAVTAGGAPQQFTFAILDNGYELTIVPNSGWAEGSQLIVRLTGGPGGIRYTDGRTFNTFELVYYVEQQ